MEMTMREKIARAIAGYKEADDGPPFADALRDTFNLLTGKRDGDVKARQLCAALADAVLEAMREPTDDMLASFGIHKARMKLNWQAMIDAAMSPPSDWIPGGMVVPDRLEE